jgi:hypothetical protein
VWFVQTRRSFFGRIIGAAAALLLPWKSASAESIKPLIVGYEIKIPASVVDSDGLTIRRLYEGWVDFSREATPLEAIQISSRLLPSLPNGFMRMTQHFVVSPEGTSMSWRITDKEVFRERT